MEGLHEISFSGISGNVRVVGSFDFLKVSLCDHIINCLSLSLLAFSLSVGSVVCF